MLGNYLKITLRSLWRNKLFSVVTIAGLALSMAVGVGLVSGIKDNFDTDHFHPYLDRTYRIITDATTPEGQTSWATTPEPIASAIRKMSAVEKLVQVRQGGPVRVLSEKGEQLIDVTFTEPSFFNVFGFTLSAGNAEAALSSPNTVLLSQSTAFQLFGGNDPMNRSIQLDGLGVFTVAGIIREPPLRTHLPLKAVLSLQTARSLEKTGALPVTSATWSDYKTTATYALLRSTADAASFRLSLSKFNHQVQANNHSQSLTFWAQPIDDITPWNPAIRNDFHAGMNWSGINTNLFLILALTVLAAFNYTSLSLARSLSRAKEVGIRKANGALRNQIFGQFLTESTLIALLALGIALIVWYNVANSGWLPQAFRKPTFFNAQLIGWLLLYVVLTGIVAGAIPAGLLSRFQPVQVLRNLQTMRLFRHVGFYRVLIVIQFAVTTMLMVFVVILQDTQSQTSNRLQRIIPPDVVLLSLRDEPAATLKHQIEQLSQVKNVSLTNQVPVYQAMEQCTLRVAGTTSPKNLSAKRIDPNYVPVFNLTMRAGRNLPSDMSATNEQFILINEATARLLPGHTPETAVGQLITLDSTMVRIAGVVVDPAEQLGPPQATVYRYLPEKATLLAIQTRPGQAGVVADACRRIWQQNVQDRLPDVSIYDQKITADMQGGFGQVNAFFRFFCMLVMLVACLGILGISAYAVDVRTREISLRRIVGASHSEIIWIVSKTFLQLLFWAGLFGVPAGWFCGKLLRDRMYNTVDLGPTNLAIGFGLVLLVGSLTILSQTIRTVWMNPVKSLRSE
ncbi:ABC transporter permease [Spirosoma terrae]|uniref:FtsX-like permease family protein n=1 Tax=Spirosoma terrae TaxID=1968276 RepID=A0A6L9LI99_9BACT|nr:ABC transporter permease [Spirosoma terrae]NDU98941.1 FtsX-like permease family protein [Spirosoma terrae]